MEKIIDHIQTVNVHHVLYNYLRKETAVYIPSGQISVPLCHTNPYQLTSSTDQLITLLSNFLPPSPGSHSSQISECKIWQIYFQLNYEN